MNNRLVMPGKRYFLFLLGPGVLLYAFVVLLPLLRSLHDSFYRFSGIRADRFVGIRNYAQLVQDEQFLNALRNNLVITLLCVIGQIGIALVIATLLQGRGIWFRHVHRSVLFFPVVLSTVIVGFLWTMLYNRDYGLINWVLRGIGLEALIHPYLDDPKTVLLFVSLPIIWQYIGYYMVIILAGMSNVSQEIYEMGEIDGAVGWRKLVYLTMPLIRETLVVCLMLCISGNMQVMDHIYVMTGGGPGSASSVMAMYAYTKSFQQANIGYGNTVSIGILLVSLFFIVLTRRFAKGEKHA